VVKKTGLAAVAGFLGLGSSLPEGQESRLRTIENLTVFIQQKKKEIEKLGPALPKVINTFNTFLRDLSPQRPSLNGFNLNQRLYGVYHNFEMAILGLDEEPLARPESPVNYGPVLNLDGAIDSDLE
jgi:hypothetical protein